MGRSGEVAGFVPGCVGRGRGRDGLCAVRCREQGVVVVGGGAAGYFAAIECAAQGGVRVEILELSRDTLQKVRISGGGRCNTTNATFDNELLSRGYPRGRRELRSPLSCFSARDTVTWFESRGLKMKTEADGRIFPVTDDSASVIDTLNREARRHGIVVNTSARVTDVDVQSAGEFLVTWRSAREKRTTVCHKVLVATGSAPAGYALASKLGHRIVAPMPSLFTLNVKDSALNDLAGVSVADAAVSLLNPAPKRRRPDDGLVQQGPLLITHWGLSGPAVLRLSAFAARLLHEVGYCGEVAINWLPDVSRPELLTRMRDMRRYSGSRTVGTSNPNKALPSRLWRLLLARAELSADVRWSDVANVGLEGLARELQACVLPFTGKGAFKEEFVTSGGVSLRDIDLRTMESKIIPNLYFAGEICDYDGITGGYNLQGAWTTGFIAGRAMGSGS